jgi:clan AA aspartic protease (TIGR02281 family)
VKRRAQALGRVVEQPATLRSPEAVARLREHAPDLLVVAAYGLILPPAVLEVPRIGCWNIHASLLPRWRGAAPIHRALLAGDAETGITIMQMDAGLDTGPMLLRRPVPIGARDDGGALHDRLAIVGAEAIVEGRPMRMLVDTGASVVTLSRADAERLGVRLKPHDFNQTLNTASGQVPAARVLLTSLSVAGVEMTSVEALVVDRDLPAALLGMSFLGRLSAFEARPDGLILRG